MSKEAREKLSRETKERNDKAKAAAQAKMAEPGPEPGAGGGGQDPAPSCEDEWDLFPDLGLP